MPYVIDDRGMPQWVPADPQEPTVVPWPWTTRHTNRASARCEAGPYSCEAPRGHLTDHMTRRALPGHSDYGYPTRYAVEHAWALEQPANDEFACTWCGMSWSVSVLTPRDRVVSADGLTVDLCQHCTTPYGMPRCTACTRYVPVGTSVLGNGDTLCPPCVEYGGYARCVRCDYLYDDVDDDGHCNSCADTIDEERFENSDLLHDYYYRPFPRFHGEGRLYMGWELETEVGDNYPLWEAAEAAMDGTDGVVYLKHDSSIYRGFELVTHPMTHDYARTEFPWKVLNAMADRGCHTNSDNNGLHVHVNRSAFDSPAHVFRWLKFLYRNSHRVRRVARRESDAWAAWSGDARKDAKKHAKGSRSGARYSAVNVQNEHTFEVRVFASSLNPAHVMAALDLVAGSVEYTRSLRSYDVNRGGWEWEAFRGWLVAQEDTYSALRVMLRVGQGQLNEVY